MPDGQWKMVPVEPTEKMIAATWAGEAPREAYRAMCAASPSVPGNAEVAEALKKCLRVFQELADAGRYPEPLIGEGWRFLTDAIAALSPSPEAGGEVRRKALEEALEPLAAAALLQAKKCRHQASESTSGVARVMLATAERWEKLYDEANRALSTNPSGEEQTGGSDWQPIETAPKDGEAVMLYKPDAPRSGDYIVSGYWGEWLAQNQVTECWIACAGGPLSQPTHWRPLHAPPTPVPVIQENEEGQPKARCEECGGRGHHEGGVIYDAAGGQMDVVDAEECRACGGKGIVDDHSLTPLTPKDVKP